MKKSKIAIFGSASHIAKGLINNFLKSKKFNLHLYTRSPEKVSRFLDAIGKRFHKDSVIHKGYRDFLKCSYDVIINCVGVGTMNKPGDAYSDYFTVTEKYDNLIIKYLLKNIDTLYISFSSGAVYGSNFSAPMEENTVNSIRINHIIPKDYYAIARLNAEAKHRAFNKLRIVDLRIFSYFSRFIDLTDRYFITELINCILNKKVLTTDSANIIRDYVHPEDLYSIVKKCIYIGKINMAFDVISAKPVEKREILDYFSSVYGLKYKIVRSLIHFSPTGTKYIYCSNYNNASCIGYKPLFSSIDTIKEESKYILSGYSKIDETRK
ncbi:MAG: NAD-dependent epimerase/dehydratase family protein [Candidatus Omnitrophica bacterium]|nr:NAD-dependent epimerase/dehydratase family protein [Candidatus Omnitrophota bacterium]